MIDYTRFRRVHQSGHMDTYCNGEMHYRKPGGWCRINRARPGWSPTEFYRCDCVAWKQYNEGKRRRD